MSDDRSEDSIEREIARHQLHEAVGKLVGIVLDDIRQKSQVAGLTAAEALNTGHAKCTVEVEHPGGNVHVFFSGPNDEEPRKLATIVAQPDSAEGGDDTRH